MFFVGVVVCVVGSLCIPSHLAVSVVYKDPFKCHFITVLYPELLIPTLELCIGTIFVLKLLSCCST